jgi:hypothetical protein
LSRKLAKVCSEIRGYSHSISASRATARITDHFRFPAMFVRLWLLNSFQSLDGSRSPASVKTLWAGRTIIISLGLTTYYIEYRWQTAIIWSRVRVRCSFWGVLHYNPSLISFFSALVVQPQIIMLTMFGGLK